MHADSVIEVHTIPVGVVGLGLMGCSITTCLLMAGHPVVAIAPIPGDLTTAPERIRHHLLRSYQEGLTQQDPQQLYARLVLSEDYNSLKASQPVSYTHLTLPTKA